MECIAHRGFAGVNPENTLTAVRSAVEIADGVEVDVRRCGSGELVVCHDETVDRVTGASGHVADFTRAELAALSVEESDDGIPAVVDVLECVPADVALNAELKESDVAADFLELAAGADFPMLVSSFHETALRAVAKLRESPAAVPTGYLTAEVDSPDSVVERAEELECASVNVPKEAATAELVDRAHEAGLTVNAWTVTDPAETRRLGERGVDRIITDFPECCPGAVE